MNRSGKSGAGEKLGRVLTWAAILYLLARGFDWLIRRRWGAFLFLACLGTIGVAMMIALLLGMVFDIAGDRSLSANDSVVAGVWITGAIVGAIFAGVTTRGLQGGKLKTRKRI